MFEHAGRNETDSWIVVLDCEVEPGADGCFWCGTGEVAQLLLSDPLEDLLDSQRPCIYECGNRCLLPRHHFVPL